PGYFDRNMGHLRDYVDALEVVNAQGEVALVPSNASEFHSILNGDFAGIIKSITFSAVPAAREAVHVVRASFTYTHEDFETALALLQNEQISSTMDISVHVHHHIYGFGITSVTITGSSDEDDRINALLDHWLALYRESREWSEEQIEQLVYRVEAQNPAEIIELILEGGMSGNPYVDRNLTCRHYNRIVAPGDFDSFRVPLMENLAAIYGVEEESVTREVLGSVRLSLNQENSVVVNADFFMPEALAGVETEVSRAVSQSLGVPLQSRPYLAELRRVQDIEVPDIEDLRRMATDAPQGEDVRRIPGFGGQIYAPGDPDSNYDIKRTQYASSSYADKQQIGGSMHPYLVAYPRPNTDDVATAIAYAKTNSKKVVARSGGHQYSGLSSGGEDTILLSMDLYNKLEFQEEDGKVYATVGVGRLLTDIAEKFKQKGVTIPHGECPRVGIGGHVQTGGYGHILRSYGLTIDHVYEFKIYLDDGELNIIQRPDSRDESSLYWAVLGGGPGSFGVLTEVTFECLQDK
ncbi:MAG: FAD-binding oxidoreductase, partial [Bacteroidota bacterium]